MMLLAAALLLQVNAAVQQPRQTEPVLQFPEPGVDDPAAYQGYQTRFYRDAAGNTLQVYVNQRDGRVVNVWGNTANESVGLTIRDAAGTPAPITWGRDSATVDTQSRRRSVEYQLRVDAPAIEAGHFQLGTMRVERDFQYFEAHHQPFGSPPFPRPELDTLIANLERLDQAERRRQLELLGVSSVAELRKRLQPALSVDRGRTHARARVEHPSFDGQNRIALELRVNRRDAEVRRTGNAVSIRSRRGGSIPLTVRVETDADPLTPLRYTEIFNPRFLQYFDSLRAQAQGILQKAATTRTAAEEEQLRRFHRMERQAKSLELLSSHEKLMAGLPNYGTYFGRDMLMTALMMEPVWTEQMAEYVISSVLGKLANSGEVSHEEALGGQAIRENAEIYNHVMAEYFQHRAAGRRAEADSSAAQARRILANLQEVRENYRMLDDDFQFPIFVARYLAGRDIPAEQKRAFLLATMPEQGGATRLSLLLRNLAYVARTAQPYAADPRAANLIAFPAASDSTWYAGSWRDSGVGYANGRYAMDINVVWVPAALESLGEMVAELNRLGFSAEQLVAAEPTIRVSPLAEYLRSPEALQRAIAAWKDTARHFLVTLTPAEVRQQVQARIAAMPAEEQRYWSAVLDRYAPTENFRFLALSLDANARPIPVVNTDVAMRLYVERSPAEGMPAAPEQVLRDVCSVMLPYPIGLFIPAIGPVVANDAYASPAEWDMFRRDHYHSPRVVWGREVNLVLLGVAKQLDAAVDPSGAPLRPELAPHVQALRQALRATREAVDASGLKDQELWSYRIENGLLLPVRYASSTDLQLWNLTDLAVQYQLARMAPTLVGGAGMP
jgi:hypothetical protein